MNNKKYLRILVVLIVSIGLNTLSVLLAPYTSPDDLGQLAFLLVILFPASALISGILSQRLRIGLVAAAIISALAAALVILVRFNSSGLAYALIYAAIAILGYLLSWGLDRIIKKIRH
ncbi:MAG TPA: hypothetical protein VEB00_08095 [Clostridia bacterium]|nr:hypothetical protein [Clostridia bacterium]